MDLRLVDHEGRIEGGGGGNLVRERFCHRSQDGGTRAVTLLARTLAVHSDRAPASMARVPGGTGRARDCQHLVYQADALWEEHTESKGMGRRTMKILLAEDDNDMRRFLAKALQNAGYDVLSFDNGLSAYNRLREEPFELLLTDIVMPEMDGIELARRATELDPDIKVMFITGFAAVALNPDSKAPKDAKVLSKPFHLRDLVNEVEKLLAA